jgi:heme/copper-type cytochrome/quinol oxidase subunit 2
MNFHIFVLVSTCVFYVILRFYKLDIQNEKRKKIGKSNFIYVLSIPVMLYILNFMYKVKEYSSGPSQNLSDNILTISDMSEQPLLTMPYPESTVI